MQLRPVSSTFYSLPNRGEDSFDHLADLTFSFRFVVDRRSSSGLATLTSTTTIGAPASFTPASLTKNKRATAPGKREIQSQDQEESSLFNRSNKGRLEVSCNRPPRLWPDSVTCVKKKVIYPPQHTVIKISKKTHTVTAVPATKTSIKTLVSTSTSTYVPNEISVAESFSVTDTIVETSTKFGATTIESTTTVSAFAPEETRYEACGAANRE